MVKDNCDIHILITNPPSLFDISTILRTLYAGLGPSCWRVLITGIKRLPIKLISDSRVPVDVVKRNVVLGGRLEDFIRKPLVIVDPRGKSAHSVEVSPRCILVDYRGVISSALDKEDSIRVSSLRLPSITYEATGVIYEFLIRRRRTEVSFEPRYKNIREAIYIAKKLVEAIKTFDNYAIFEPNTVAYVVRRVYLGHKLLLDPVLTRININHVSGEVTEEIHMKAYSSYNLREEGSVTIKLVGNTVEIIENSKTVYRFYIDPVQRKLCIDRDYCIRGYSDI